MDAAPAPPLQRPAAPFVLSLLAGLFILLGGLIFLLVFRTGGLFFGPWALIATICGVLVLLGSGVLFTMPDRHSIAGVVILVFSAISLVGLGGFVAGMVLGIIGGSLAVAWDPREALRRQMYGGYPAYPYAAAPYAASPYAASPYAGYGSYAPYGYASYSAQSLAPMSPYRLCMGCGRWISWAAVVCPLCGTQAPRPPAAPPGPATQAAPTPSPDGQGAAPAPAAAPTATSAPTRSPCPTCHAEAEWVPAYQRWYCPAEKRYF